MPYCAAYRCQNSSTQRPDLVFFTFPKDEQLKKQWLVALQREDLYVTSHTRVCSDHFREEDQDIDMALKLAPHLFKRSKNRPGRRLKPNAIPVSPKVEKRKTETKVAKRYKDRELRKIINTHCTTNKGRNRKMEHQSKIEGKKTRKRGSRELQRAQPVGGLQRMKKIKTTDEQKLPTVAGMDNKILYVAPQTTEGNLRAAFLPLLEQLCNKVYPGGNRVHVRGTLHFETDTVANLLQVDEKLNASQYLKKNTGEMCADTWSDVSENTVYGNTSRDVVTSTRHVPGDVSGDLPTYMGAISSDCIKQEGKVVSNNLDFANETEASVGQEKCHTSTLGHHQDTDNEWPYCITKPRYPEHSLPSCSANTKETMHHLVLVKGKTEPHPTHMWKNVCTDENRTEGDNVIPSDVVIKPEPVDSFSEESVLVESEISPGVVKDDRGFNHAPFIGKEKSITMEKEMKHRTHKIPDLPHHIGAEWPISHQSFAPMNDTTTTRRNIKTENAEMEIANIPLELVAENTDAAARPNDNVSEQDGLTSDPTVHVIVPENRTTEAHSGGNGWIEATFRYSPKTGFATEPTDAKILKADEPIPAGYQLLAEGTDVAVPSDWFLRMTMRTRKYSGSFRVAKLLEAMLNVDQYGVKGGLKKLRQSSPRVASIIRSLEVFATTKCGMDSGRFNRFMLDKMKSGYRVIKRLQLQQKDQSSPVHLL